MEPAPPHQGRARTRLASAATDARTPQNRARTMPFLLPLPEFQPGELTKMGLTGRCELQICRSTGPWSASGQKYGAPTNAARGNKASPAGAGTGLSHEEKDAPLTRSVLIKNLTKASPWTLPTPAPETDANELSDVCASSCLD
jgi:hypothetical protein